MVNGFLSYYVSRIFSSANARHIVKLLIQLGRSVCMYIMYLSSSSMHWDLHTLPPVGQGEKQVYCDLL